jgi:restriction endonuclease Mrr
VDTLLEASRERAWSQLADTVSELEQALGSYERTRYPERGRTDAFTVSLRRDNQANALKQLADIRRRVHAHHMEALSEDVANVMYLSRRAAIHREYFTDEFAQALAILEAGEAELLYETPQLIVPAPVVVAVSDGLLAALAQTPRLLYEIAPRKFEEIVAELFRKEGFDVELTQATRDGGADIIALSRRMNIRQKMIIECKRYKPENRVGIAVVQRLLGVKTHMNANMAVVVTTSSFSREALAVARERFWDLDLKAYADVVGWLQAAVPR